MNKQHTRDLLDFEAGRRQTIERVAQEVERTKGKGISRDYLIAQLTLLDRELVIRQRQYERLEASAARQTWFIALAVVLAVLVVLVLAKSVGGLP